MIQRIVVVSGKDFGNRSQLFSHDQLPFDILFAQMFSWEEDQDIKVMGSDRREKGLILFRNAYDHGPKFQFTYKGATTDFLHPFQFNVGDSLSVRIKSDGGLAYKDFNKRLMECYFAYRVSLSGKILTMDEFNMRLSEEEQFYFHQKPPSLIFGYGKVEEIEYR